LPNPPVFRLLFILVDPGKKYSSPSFLTIVVHPPPKHSFYVLTNGSNHSRGRHAFIPPATVRLHLALPCAPVFSSSDGKVAPSLSSPQLLDGSGPFGIHSLSSETFSRAPSLRSQNAFPPIPRTLARPSYESPPLFQLVRIDGLQVPLF